MSKDKRSQEKRAEQLGMNVSTAQNRLKKNIMFSLIQRCSLDNCFQCGDKIEEVEHLSVEHKIPWLNSTDPLELFFNLDNIAFSHLSCNVKSARRPPVLSDEEKLKRKRQSERSRIYCPSKRKEQYARTGK